MTIVATVNNKHRLQRTLTATTLAILTALGVLAVGVSPAMAGEEHHLVRRGETLTKIAKDHGVTVRDLITVNKLTNPDRVLAGKKLKIAKAPAARKPSSPATPAMVPISSSRPANPVPVPAARAGIRPFFERYATEAGIPVNLAMAVAWQESGWKASAVSSTNAVGVMQLMPLTVQFVSLDLLKLPKQLDPRDPAQNIRMGTRFLRYLLDQTQGDLPLALASYYQGLTSVRTKGPYDSSIRFAANIQALQQRF